MSPISIDPPKPAPVNDHDHTSRSGDGGRLTNDEHDGFAELRVVGAPGSPQANRVRLYVLDQNGFPVIEAIGAAGLARRLVRDSMFIAKCKEAAGVTAGQAVYISGASGATEEFELARADVPGTMPAVGLVSDTVGFNGFARILFSGKISGIDTSGFSSEGALLFVSESVAGELTETPPTFPNLIQRVGIVTRKHGGQGEIIVNPPGQALAQIDHGTLAGLSDDDHPQYMTQAEHDASPVQGADHGLLLGLGDDDHAQYLTEVRHDALPADNPHGVTLTQAVTADPGTNITAAELETLSNGSNADLLHVHAGSGGGNGPFYIPSSGRWLIAGVPLAAAGTTLAITANRLYMVWFSPFRSYSIDALGFDVNTGAGTKARLGVYSDVAGVPTTLLAQTADTTTTTGNKIATLAFAFTAGTGYWIALLCDGAANIDAFAVANMRPLGTTAPNNAASAAHVAATIGAGWSVLPASPGALTWTSATTPALALRSA
jgi:hypothetical protein